MLWPLSLIYGAAAALRNFGYDSGLLASHRVSCKVISVGNLTVGGTGKTPTVIYLAQKFRRAGQRVVVLSRGYDRRSRGLQVVSDERRVRLDAIAAGDEPYLTAKRLPGIPVIVCKDRVQGARFAERHFSPDVLLLDDAFQHRRLHRDLDIVTLRAQRPFGNGFLLPAGPLREPRKNLKRAHLLWVNGNPEPNHFVKKNMTNLPVVMAAFRTVGLFTFDNQKREIELKGKRVVAFCGLGNPNSFRNSLEEMGAHVAAFFTFRDHYRYSKRDIESLKHRAQEQSARYVITTEKDWVKLENFDTPPDWLFLRVAVKPESESLVEKYLSNLM